MVSWLLCPNQKIGKGQRLKGFKSSLCITPQHMLQGLPSNEQLSNEKNRPGFRDLDFRCSDLCSVLRPPAGLGRLGGAGNSALRVWGYLVTPEKLEKKNAPLLLLEVQIHPCRHGQ